MGKTITSEVLVAYSQCPRKAFLLLCTKEKGSPHEYVRILGWRKCAHQDKNIKFLKQQHPNIHPYNIENLRNGSDFLVNAELEAGGFETNCGYLTKVRTHSSLGRYSYEPAVFAGTYSISKEQKLELLFVGYVLGQLQNKLPVFGKIIGLDGKSHKSKLKTNYRTLILLLGPLQEWATAPSSEPPPLVLNKYCSYCQFRSLCEAEAEKEDNLSLLDRVTPKLIRKYEKKGIFTVKQLSYLFKPRRRRKKQNKKLPSIHKPELQALAIRTGKTYLQGPPELSRQPIELFLDIEGIPDQQFYYLIGLLICEADKQSYHYFWADTLQKEEQIWAQFLEKVNQYPDASIFHYGSYELKAINKLGKRYRTDTENLKNRLINLNPFIHGKVYFPVRSNGLKEIGKLIGASWTSSRASGLQSLVWRYRWEETRNNKHKNLLVTYNKEDCEAVKLLTEELSKIEEYASSLSHIDFVDQPKQHTTEVGAQLHNQFETILKFAHIDYEKRKISLQHGERGQSGSKRKCGGKKGHRGYRRVALRAKRIVRVPRKRKCSRHKGEPLRASRKVAERTVIDLVFTKNGIRKSVTKYIGTKSYCPKCHYYHNPRSINKLSNQTFGHSFKAWVIYQRLFLRLTYQAIDQSVQDLFSEKISQGTIANSQRYFAKYYSGTERLLIQEILASPFIHVDETKVNIQGVEHYVWVFTDGNRVVFRLTETREANIVHEILSGYRGILITDFYSGYDSVKCKQQKCWVHLIRDINNDLWKAPFDREFEKFILEVRGIILPIFKTAEKYGLKKRHFNKFKKKVDQFYKNNITGRVYKSELTIKYQKRFIRYRESLFAFLEHDGIPWNNNTAERALRHLAVQRKISGSFFKSVAHQYLLLLGVAQTCRFQGKSLLKFLLSKEKDIDKFKKSKLIKSSQPVNRVEVEVNGGKLNCKCQKREVRYKGL